MSTTRKEGQRHREEVFNRDGGVCSECKCDTVPLLARLRSVPLIDGRKEWRYGRVDAHAKLAFRRVLGRHRMRAFVILGRLWGIVIGHTITSLWQMDHITPVVEGGGECGLENLRTLCLRCHNAETSALAGRMARRPTKGIGKFN